MPVRLQLYVTSQGWRASSALLSLHSLLFGFYNLSGFRCRNRRSLARCDVGEPVPEYLPVLIHATGTAHHS